MNIEGFFIRLSEWGVAEILVPFILVFTIVFAVMQKTEILGKGKKNYNSMIALVMGLAVIFPHVLRVYPPESDPVNIINSALPNVSVVLIGILMFLLIIGLLGGEIKWMGTSMSGLIAIIALLIILFIFGRAAGWFMNGQLPNWLQWLDDPDTVAFIIILLVFAILVWWITKDDSTKEAGFFKDSLENLGKMFKKGD